MNRIRNWATSVQAWMVTLLLLVLFVAVMFLPLASEIGRVGG